MKTIFLILILSSGAMAQAQHANSQAAQVITLRLHPISFIDLSAANKTDNKKDLPPTSSAREIIVNKNRSSDAALPVDEKNSNRNMIAYNTVQPQQVYTFSSR